MKKVLATVVCCLSLLVVSMDADAARRFGGSGSKGRTTSSLFSKAPANKPASNSMDSTASKQQATNTAAQKSQAQTTAQQKPQNSFMRNALTGIAAALGIAALLSFLGVDASSLLGMFASIAMIGLIAFAIFALIGMFRKKSSYVTSVSGAQASRIDTMQAQTSHTHMTESRATPSVSSAVEPTARGSVLESLRNFDFANGQLQKEVHADEITRRVGAEFDRSAFLRASKKYYVMFQEAWAKGDITSVASYWDNDLYIEMTHELASRQGSVFTVEMVNLDAQLVGAVREKDRVQVAVHFTGALRIDGRLEVINDLWVMEKPAQSTGGWLVIGTKTFRN